MGRLFLIRLLATLAIVATLPACLEGGSGSGGDQGSNPPSDGGSGDPGSDPDRIPASDVPSSVLCSAGKVMARASSESPETEYPSIQAAIDAAIQPGWIINVGRGNWNESLLIDSKKNLLIKTACYAKVKNVVFLKSENVRFDGFVVDAAGTSANGIDLKSDEGANEGIVVANVEIRNAPSDYMGVRVGHRNRAFQLLHSFVHSNKQEGVFFQGGPIWDLISPSLAGLSQDWKTQCMDIVKNFRDDDDDSSHDRGENTDIDDCINSVELEALYADIVKNQHVIDGSYISENGANGLRLTGGALRINIKDARIVNNGLSAGAMNRYGIRVTGALRKKDVLLTNSVIAHNHGKVFKNKGRGRRFDDDEKHGKGHSKDDWASVDISNLILILNPASSGNLMTSGSEGFSITKLVDSAAPAITIEVGGVLTNLPALEVPVMIADQSPVNSKLYLNGAQVFSSSKFWFRHTVTLAEGTNVIKVVSQDAAGNIAEKTVSTVVLDLSAPVIDLLAFDGVLTNQHTFSLPVNITDLSAVTTEIFVNGVSKFTTTEKSFTASLPLTEGNNVIEVRAKDQWGYEAVPKFLNQIVADFTPPVLSLNPTPNQWINDLQFIVSGSSNEAVTQVSVNGFAVPLSPDKRNFTGTYTAASEGMLDLVWNATDLAGNVAIVTVPVEISLRILRIELVKVEPAATGSKLLIKGAQNASRGGAILTATAGLFNVSVTTAKADGSFVIEMNPFQSATIDVLFPFNNRRDSGTVSYHIDTNFAGKVHDIDDTPIPGVCVTFVATSKVSCTGPDGVFSFSSPPTGDQELIVDGTTVPSYITGPDKRFSKTHIRVAVGVTQLNVLPRPIFLTPIYLNANSQQITVATGGTVTSPLAPGVTLRIPADKLHLPDGAASGRIGMVEVIADRSTVPPVSFARPDSVISLEPSGAFFSEPVELTVPNVNELPPGTELVILSMNSATGTWGIDGAASVSMDGQSVVTKPGMGITHFSTIYAAPAGPSVAPIGGELPGADTSFGGVSTSIKLPSAQIMGSSVAPTLVYNSQWASPNAIVTNLFDIPEHSVTIDYENFAGGQVLPVKTHVSKCGAARTNCHDEEKELWMVFNFVSNESYTHTYTPDKITAQFSMLDLESEIIPYEGKPQRSVISYFADFLNPDTEKFPGSGFYPYNSHYEIHLKHMIVGTRRLKYWTGLQAPAFTEPEPITGIPDQVGEVYPSDLTGLIAVQNHAESPVGRGWRVAGPQYIVNPQENRIMIEEADGSSSSYVISDRIEPLVSDSSYRMSEGMSLQWPYAYVVGGRDGSGNVDSATTDGRIYIQKVDLRNQTHQIIAQPKGYEATLTVDRAPTQFAEMQRWITINVGIGVIHTWENIPPEYPPVFTPPFFGHHWVNFVWDREYHTVQGRSRIGGLLFNNGSLIAADTLNHRLISTVSTSSAHIAGQRSADINPMHAYSNNAPTLNTYCQNNYGAECSDFSIHNEGSVTGENFCWWQWRDGTQLINNCNVTNYLAPWESRHQDGPGLADYNGEGAGTSRSLNTPKSMALAPDGRIAFADYGNYRVRIYNPVNGQINALAGNGSDQDNGDGGQSIIAGVYHPQALAYDNQGNLYIATERGYVRKVDINTGIITTVAGNPSGSLAPSGPALNMRLNSPQGLAFDNDNGYLYISDTGNNRVLRLVLAANYLQTVAGNNSCSSPSADGDNGPALSASLCSPRDLSFDDQGNLLINDSGHNKIKRIQFQVPSGGLVQFSPTQDDLSSLQRNSNGTWKRTYRSGTFISYDTNGRQVAAQDRVGRISTFEYDGQGRVTKQTHPTGQFATYSYSGNKLASITDTASRTTSFEYSGNDLKKVVFPDGSHRDFTYNDRGQLTSESDQLGFKTQYVLNEWGRLEKTIRPDNKETLFKDSVSGTVGNNNTDAAPGDLKSFYGSGDTGLTDGVRTPGGTSVDVSRGFTGQPRSIASSTGDVAKVEYDSKGRVTKSIRSNGTFIEYAYNSTGDLLSTTDSATGLTESTTYNSFGQPLVKRDLRNNPTTYNYNAGTGLISSVNYPTGQVVSYVYNSLGLPTSVSLNTAGQVLTSTTAYNGAGLVTSSQSPDQVQQTASYDNAGNALTSVTSKLGTTLESYTYVYDSLNRMTSVTTTGGKTVLYTYSDRGELLKMKDPLNNETFFEYNSLAKPIKKTDALGFITTMKYDDNGNLIEFKDPKGQIAQLGYDGSNRLTSKLLPDNAFSFSYDGKGKLLSASNNVSHLSLTYDSTDKRLSTIRARGIGALSDLPDVTLTYGYDNIGNRTSMHNPLNGTTTYAFDILNRMTSITNPQGDVFGYSYDQYGRVSNMTRPGSSTTFTYETQSGFLSSIIHSKAGNAISSLIYQRNGIGNVTLIQTNGENRNLAYDSDHQLTSSNSASVNESYTYDALGNRSTDQGGAFTYDQKSQRLTEDYRYTYFYDGNGNMVLKQPKQPAGATWQYTYNSENQMTRLKKFDGISGPLVLEMEFAYDAFGRRIQKSVVDETAPGNPQKTYKRRFVYDGDNIITELNGSNAVLASYTQSGGVDDVLAVNVSSDGVTAGLAQTSGKYGFLKNDIGSITEVTDNSGSIIQRYKYSSFGEVLALTDGLGADIRANPALKSAFTFTGREPDEEAGLYYFRARMFDSSIGRFLQEDPKPGRLDLPNSFLSKYVYVANSPLNLVDPFGQDFWDDFGTVLTIGAVVAAAIVTGGAIAGALYPVLGSSFGAGLVIGAAGGLAGGIVGGLTGAVGFGLMGKDMAQGFAIGSFIGGIVGGISASMKFSQLSTSGAWTNAEADKVMSGTQRGPLVAGRNRFLGVEITWGKRAAVSEGLVKGGWGLSFFGAVSMKVSPLFGAAVIGIGVGIAAYGAGNRLELEFNREDEEN